MKISFAASLPADWSTLVVPVGKDGVENATASLDHGEGVTAAVRLARFEGESGAVVEQIYAQGGAARRVLIVGTGDGSAEGFEKAGAAVTARLLTSGETKFVADLTKANADEAASFAVGARLRGWRHDAYRTKLKDKQKISLAEVVIVGDEAGWAAGSAAADGAEFTRNLVAEPANILYPESFVERARAKLEPLGVTIEVLDVPAMEKLGMGSLLGVGQGSSRPSRVMAMRWAGGNGDETPLALVGKGVTFDTGGISLKPGPGMEDMKWDMGGAGAVTGAMVALATRKAKVNVVGVVGLVENMPDGNAIRPGDVLTSMSGQTIEVLNTDAEGRLVLADAITWTQHRFKPQTIVDLATLTGAMIISLGKEHGGIFSNDDALATQLIAAGGEVGEKLWRFPMSDTYDKLIDSPIADMKNIGPREGGSITAAQFIKRFVDEGVKWAHLDIAGMVWAGEAGRTWDKGATGYGVRLLDRFVKDNWEG
ncbi:putative cytosol aminopeptidase [Sphingomonas antarctica]|uniref:leucyl aminopeptidase n=1 Tax=Sphingomonas antarctica TaxID=2040274 RepID=UPI0039E821F1